MPSADTFIEVGGGASLSRGRRASPQACALRALMLKAKENSSTIVTMPCSYDTMTSKLVQEAGLPVVFLSGYPVSASLGLPDTGYLDFHEMVQRVQAVYREVDVPIIVDGDTGFGGSPMNVRRTVRGFAMAGAAGVMIEDQTSPKRCGHASGKAVVDRDEAYARIHAAVDARNEGTDIWILARTDSLYLGYEEALERARQFIKIGADAVFVEALPDRQTMERFASDIDFPCMANIIPGGVTEEVSAKSLATMGFAAVAYPFTLLAAQISATKKALEDIGMGHETGDICQTLTADEVHRAVGFPQYYKDEERYTYNSKVNGKNGHHWG